MHSEQEQTITEELWEGRIDQDLQHRRQEEGPSRVRAWSPSLQVPPSPLQLLQTEQVHLTPLLQTLTHQDSEHHHHLPQLFLPRNGPNLPRRPPTLKRQHLELIEEQTQLNLQPSYSNPHQQPPLQPRLHPHPSSGSSSQEIVEQQQEEGQQLRQRWKGEALSTQPTPPLPLPRQQPLLLPSPEQAPSPLVSQEGQLQPNSNSQLRQLPTSLPPSLQPRIQPQLLWKNPSSDPPTSKRNTLDSSPTVEAAVPSLSQRTDSGTVSHPPPLPLQARPQTSTHLPPTATPPPLPPSLPHPPFQPHPPSPPSENLLDLEEDQQRGWVDTCRESRVEMEEGWEEEEERRTMNR